MRTSFPNLTRSAEDMVTEEDRLVLYYRIQGTRTGNGGLAPYPPTRERWDMLGVTAFRFANGLLEEEPWAVNFVAAMPPNMARANARLMIHAIWGGRNVDDIAKYYATNFLYHGTKGLQFKGRDGLRHMFIDFHDVAPDAQFVIDDQVSDGDKVCTRWRLLSDSRVVKADMSLFRLDNGLAAEQLGMRSCSYLTPNPFSVCGEGAHKISFLWQRAWGRGRNVTHVHSLTAPFINASLILAKTSSNSPSTRSLGNR